MTPLVLSFLAQGRTLSDTQVVRMIPGGLQQAVSVAELSAILLVFALLIAAIVLLLRLRKSLEATGASFNELTTHLKQISENANRISAQARDISDLVRNDITSIHETVTYANERAHQAVSDLADRVDEFNETLGEVHDKTRRTIVGAAAAIKGVQAGVAAFSRMGGKKRRPTRNGAPPEHNGAALDDEPDDDRAEDEFEDDFEYEDQPPRPRLRRRAPADS